MPIAPSNQTHPPSTHLRGLLILFLLFWYYLPPTNTPSSGSGSSCCTNIIIIIVYHYSTGAGWLKGRYDMETDAVTVQKSAFTRWGDESDPFKWCYCFQFFCCSTSPHCSHNFHNIITTYKTTLPAPQPPTPRRSSLGMTNWLHRQQQIRVGKGLEVWAHYILR